MQRRCKLFVYGGCKGNANNFLSEYQCVQQCGDESALALLTQEFGTTTELDICSQKKDAGICPGNVPRFYFDKELGRCGLFSYGGCGGNSNNFGTQDECVAHCGGPSGGIFSFALQGKLYQVCRLECLVQGFFFSHSTKNSRAKKLKLKDFLPKTQGIFSSLHRALVLGLKKPL